MIRGKSRRPRARLAGLAAGLALLAGCTVAPEREPVATERYVHSQPRFSLHYPATWKRVDPAPGEYLHVAAPKGAPNIVVAPAPADLPAEATAVEAARSNFERLRASQAFREGEIAAAREVELADGTPALESLVTWRHPLYRVQLATLYLVAHRGGTALRLAATDLGEDLTPEHRRWCYSLRIQ